MSERIADPAERARAEWFLAYAETDLGDVSAVDERLDRALAGFRTAGDRWGTAAVLGTRAKLSYLRTDRTAIERDGGRSAELFRELGDRWGLLQATAWLGGLAEMVGDYADATRLHREGLRMAEELGLWSEVSVRLGWLGWIAVHQGDYPRARELRGQAQRLAAEHPEREGDLRLPRHHRVAGDEHQRQHVVVDPVRVPQQVPVRSRPRSDLALARLRQQHAGRGRRRDHG